MQTTPRIRGRALQRIRNQVFDAQPLCVECKRNGRVRVPVEVDHVIPLHKGGTYDLSNLQPLCANCHEAKTAKDRGYRPKHRIGIDGYPIDAQGNPIEW